MKHILGALLCTVLLGAAPGPVRDDALYQARFETLLRNKGLFTDYAPLEAVPGAKRYRPIPLASPAERTIAASALAKAEAYAAANRSSAFLVWRGGRLQTAAYFGGATASTPLTSKSLSKPLTAIAIGRAIAAGKIRSLDQPVADFFPEWRGTPKASILVRHLLDMRSGLLEQLVSNDPDHPINRAYIDPDHGWHIVNAYPLVAAPGSKYLYNNATSELVALLIERATGRRYAEFIGREVLAPIGAAGGKIWIDRPGGLAHSGCCMTLPAESWLRLGILLLDDGIANGRRLLPKGYVREMITPTMQNPHYGLGIWVGGDYTERRGFGAPGSAGPQVLHSAPYLDRDLYLFDGNANQVVYVSPATRMVILRTGEAPPRQPEWDNSVLPNLLIAGASGPAPIPQPR